MEMEEEQMDVKFETDAGVGSLRESGELIIGLDSQLNAGEEVSVVLTNVISESQIPPQHKREIIVAGPTNPLNLKRVQVLKPQKFSLEPLNLECEWLNCDFKTTFMRDFMEHVVSHVPFVQVVLKQNLLDMNVFLHCNWDSCPWITEKASEDLQRHLYLHAYHTKLKCIGSNTSQRCGVNPCRADSSNRNILPDLSENLLCAWEDCCEQFTNIQLYYYHISNHIDETPRGRNVKGGIKCGWRGCVSVFPNATKLRDHMRSHTQEKLLACPTCGGLFANRTRYFDHCRRQVLLEDESFACDVCMKCFSTARLLRDHIRSHVNTYKCSICEMSCSSPSSLNNHMKYRHSQEKPFACDLCSYRAKSYNDILRHTKIHSNPTYKCEEEGCDFQSKSLTTLRSHCHKVHDKNKPSYACHVCEKTFLKGYYLTKHLIGVHKLQWPSGHTRFRYKMNDDGLFRLLTVRYESVEEPQVTN